MIGAGSLEYAHARLAARWGQRPDEALWRRLEGTRGLGAVLELVRSSALAPWVEGLGARADVHAIDAVVRRQARARVAEVAAWMPPAWHAAIVWCARLVDLPLLLHLARGGTAPAWVADDAACAPLLEAPARVASLPALQTAAREGPDALWSAWAAHWLRQRPPEAATVHEHALRTLLQQHRSAFGAPDALDGPALRRALQQRLTVLRRRALVEPAMAFIDLALMGLEGERLRGELVRRAAFPQRLHGPSGAAA